MTPTSFKDFIPKKDNHVPGTKSRRNNFNQLLPEQNVGTKSALQTLF